jgi:NADH:ubiquinone oxidoreductase subunit 3 (subunit A)
MQHKIYSFYYVNYIEFLELLIFSFLISSLFFILSYFLVVQTHDKEMVSHYECGFIPFDDTRKPFEVKFYLVAILFLIFDLEITFLFPFAIILKGLSLISVLSITFFISILTLGFFFEWIYKGLDWNI